jgi:hypothetical protein
MRGGQNKLSLAVISLLLWRGLTPFIFSNIPGFNR